MAEKSIACGKQAVKGKQLYTILYKGGIIKAVDEERLVYELQSGMEIDGIKLEGGKLTGTEDLPDVKEVNTDFTIIGMTENGYVIVNAVGQMARVSLTALEKLQKDYSIRVRSRQKTVNRHYGVSEDAVHQITEKSYMDSFGNVIYGGDRIENLNLGPRTVHEYAQHNLHVLPYALKDAQIGVIQIEAEHITIMDYAFVGCSVRRVEIIGDVLEIGEHAFEGCRNLEKAELQRVGHIRRIGRHAFSGCSRLKEAVFSAAGAVEAYDSSFDAGVRFDGYLKSKLHKDRIGADGLLGEKHGRLCAAWRLYGNGSKSYFIMYDYMTKQARMYTELSVYKYCNVYGLDMTEIDSIYPAVKFSDKITNLIETIYCIDYDMEKDVISIFDVDCETHRVSGQWLRMMYKANKEGSGINISSGADIQFAFLGNGERVLSGGNAGSEGLSAKMRMLGVDGYVYDRMHRIIRTNIDAEVDFKCASNSSIYPYTFMDDKFIGDIVIHEGCREIMQKAFSGSSVRKAEIHAKVIGADAFYGCSSLKEVILGDEVKEIHKDAFTQCPNLTEIEIPAGCSCDAVIAGMRGGPSIFKTKITVRE